MFGKLLDPTGLMLRDVEEGLQVRSHDVDSYAVVLGIGFPRNGLEDVVIHFTPDRAHEVGDCIGPAANGAIQLLPIHTDDAGYTDFLLELPLLVFSRIVFNWRFGRDFPFIWKLASRCGWSFSCSNWRAGKPVLAVTRFRQAAKETL